MTLTIPEEWKLDNRIVQKAGNCVLDVPKLVLSTEELNITDMSASSLLKRLQTGELSSYTVTKAFCHRACIGHQLTNCLTSLFCDEALSRAIELDNHFKEHGPVGPLHGLPVSFKDAFLIRGHKTTFGYLSWKDNVSERDGLPVSIMKSLGVVPFCQTNIAQGLLSVESTNNIFGTVLNPQNTNLTASGSSGGEAALVAMKGSPFGMCTDAGGSIRLPASSNAIKLGRVADRSNIRRLRLHRNLVEGYDRGRYVPLRLSVPAFFLESGSAPAEVSYWVSLSGRHY
ncbi:hypothetical protein KL915_002792 [Ogataea haglerorum]|nr:hypothetical protein KL915_002792 [Ogataea haglerorum]